MRTRPLRTPTIHLETQQSTILLVTVFGVLLLPWQGGWRLKKCGRAFLDRPYWSLVLDVECQDWLRRITGTKDTSRFVSIVTVEIYLTFLLQYAISIQNDNVVTRRECMSLI